MNECSHPFSLYLSGSETPVWRTELTQGGALHVALSFFSALDRMPKTKPWLLDEQYPEGCEILVDAGAFSASKRPIMDPQGYHDKYTHWLMGNEESNISRLSLVMEYAPPHFPLESVKDWREHFWEVHVPREKFIPIWHEEYGLEHLESMCTRYAHVGIKKPSSRLIEGRLRSLITTHGIKLHGVGLNTPIDMSKLPYSSVHSMVWLNPTKTSALHIWAQNRMNIYLGKDVDNALKRHEQDIIDAGFNPDGFKGEHRELVRYTIWAWAQYEADMCERRERTGGGVISAIRGGADTSPILNSGEISAQQSNLPVVRGEPKIFPGMEIRSKKVQVEEGEDPRFVPVPVLKESGLRGCNACLVPESRVLTHHLTWENIGGVVVGDELSGFDEQDPVGKGNRRKWRKSIVEEIKWDTKPVYNIITDHGLVSATRDHRWLLHPSELRHQRREGKSSWATTGELISGQSLRGMEIGSPCHITDSFRAGYISGISDGDGTFRFDPNKDRYNQPQVYWRVALTDKEPLERLKLYLKCFDIEVNIRGFNSGVRVEGDKGIVKIPVQGFQEMYKVETRSMDSLQKILNLTVEQFTPDFAAGYLSGMFDAEGSFDGKSIRIHQIKDTGELNQCIRSGKLLGLPFYRENSLTSVRVPGFYINNFFTRCQPAISRKYPKDRSLNVDPWKIEAIEYAGIKDVVDIQTSTSTFFAEGIATHNCYLAARCPEYNPGALCAFNLSAEIDTPEALVSSLTSVLGVQFARVMFARAGEEADGSLADPIVSEEMDRYLKMVQTIKEIQSDSSFLEIKVKGAGQPGLLATIMGNVIGAAQGNQAAQTIRPRLDANRVEEFIGDFIDIKDDE